MNRLLLSLMALFSLGLQAEPTQQHVDTFVKLIATADSAAFKKAYTQHKIQNSDIKAVLHETAQKTKAALQTEFAVLGDTSVSKGILAKGITQTYGALSSGLAATILGLMFAEKIYFPQEQTSNSCIMREGLMSFATHSYIFMPTAVFCSLWRGKDNAYMTHKTRTIKRFSFLIALTAATACGLGIFGITNMRKGLNYKAHLEQQVKNIDEIIEVLTQTSEGVA